jgi:hypothetical protein
VSHRRKPPQERRSEKNARRDFAYYLRLPQLDEHVPEKLGQSDKQQEHKQNRR